MTHLARLASRDGIVIRSAANKQDGEFIITLVRSDPAGEILARSLWFIRPADLSGTPEVESVLLYFLTLASRLDPDFDIVPGAKELALAPRAPQDDAYPAMNEFLGPELYREYMGFVARPSGLGAQSSGCALVLLAPIAGLAVSAARAFGRL